eukprot:TRINITY_DN415_c0_g6_i1.p1 TRINITY_DN415_c0_g6~~TRINITY_DN415_c0_g6_i1.p1  ORF type:complete len:351 (+),score=84.43 TRINITY_DN415_c0_g6_i1:293-1345(+)
MGICGSNIKTDAAETKKANTALENERSKNENEIKLLLLGAGESGKSTIAKQMKIIHLNGFTNEERAQFKSIIYNNVIGSMRALVTAAKDLNIELDPKSKKHAENVCIGEEYFTGDLTAELAADIKVLWADAGIREAFARSAEFQLNDCAAYYFDNIERIAKPDYLPSEQDLLRSRAKTTGIVEICFTVQNTNFRVVDVGGQRSERKKWMHCFQDVTAVIFCVALSEYDLKLYEDDTTNRMHESVKLFREICNNKWFVDTAMILFLNKKDIFEEKIKKVDLKVCFPEYTGGCNFENATTYIRNQFVVQNQNPSKSVYPHITCATDTSNIQHVFNVIRDVLIGKAIMSSDLF